jgi:acetyl esterase/lipase
VFSPDFLCVNFVIQRITEQPQSYTAKKIILAINNMRQFIAIILVLFSIDAFSQQKELIYLWPGKVPGETKEKQKPSIDTIRKDGVLRYNEITNPAIEVWLPDPKINKGVGVIVCPGGAYRILSYDKEGTEIAAWLNKLGCAAFVLSYRVPDKQLGALQDAQRAMRIVRNNAAKWKIDAEKIGIMGFSAGGSLSARASTLFDKKTYPPVDKTDSLSCRPSFTMLIYPAYLDQGENKTLTPELKLSKETPPVFIFQTADDPYGNSSLVMASSLRDAKLPVEIHILPKGGHGYGMRPGNTAAETWPGYAEKWMISILSQGK